MSLKAQYTNVYRLLHKQRMRDAMLEGAFANCEGLNDSERAELAALSPSRVHKIADMLADDLGRSWYQSRFPATWQELQRELGHDHIALTMAIMASEVFESRINDDPMGDVLAAFIHEQPLPTESGVADLLTFERYLAGWWPHESPICVAEFGCRVTELYENVLAGRSPTNPNRRSQCLLLANDGMGVNVAEIPNTHVETMNRLLSGDAVSGCIGRECLAMIEEIQANE